MTLRVLLVEPYYSGSHRAWADGWAAASAHDVVILHHPAEFWRWRMRGAAVTMAELIVADCERHGPPDVVVVSDMIDVAALLGLCRRSLPPTVQVVLYMHENQLLYPLGPSQQPDESLSLVNWKSMLAADAVWFNSDFQRAGFFAAVPRLLHHMPDMSHEHLIAQVEEKSIVLPVGVDLGALLSAERREPGDPPVILWNQRWDHDKNPGAVFRALVKLHRAGVDFSFVLAGENQRVDPQEFAWVQDELGDRVIHSGHAPRAVYENLLAASDIVVSAAHHEFFGISIVEAIAAGAVPVLPDRQSYPEVIPAQWHEPVLYADGELRDRLAEVIADVGAARDSIAGLRESMGRFDWPVVALRYDRALSEF